MVDLNPADEVEAPLDEHSGRAENPEAADTDSRPAEGSDSETIARSGTSGLIAGLAMGAFGFFLAIAYLPLVFDRFARYDDEGFYLTSIRAFLKSGSLYSHTRSAYGPFYYSVMGLLYRVTGSQPTLFNGRLIVLILAAMAGCIFGATVFRVTRQLSLSVLCQFASFLVLMRVAGNEPMHPAGLIMLLLSIMAYATVSYVMTQRTVFLVAASGAAGAIAMCKINVGIFAIAALVMGLVVGNVQFGKVWRALVAIGVVALPVLLVMPRLYEVAYVQFGVLVALTLLATVVPLSVDEVAFPTRTILIAAAAAIGAVVVSSIWPLLHGTTPGEFVKGVITAPLKQVDHLSIPAQVSLNWVPISLVAVSAIYALSHRNHDDEQPTIFGSALLPSLLLVAAALWVFGLGLGSTAFSGTLSFGAFMPAIALLCALAWTSAAPPKIRIALRFLVPLAILQSLHAYPVAGSQQAWSTVAIFMPCSIALAAGLERLPAWRQAGGIVRSLAIASLALAFTLSMGLWPIAMWRNYDHETALGLPGTRLVRLSKQNARDLQQLAHAVKRDCDTFYSAPGFDSLYIFTGLTPPTGLLTNHVGVLNTNEQTELAGQLAAVSASGKRLCIVRDLTTYDSWTASSYGRGPLGAAIAPYTEIVARAGLYTVSVKRAGA